MADKTAIHDAFTKQADFCRKMGSPITADAIEAACEALSRDSETGRRRRTGEVVGLGTRGRQNET